MVRRDDGCWHLTPIAHHAIAATTARPLEPMAAAAARIIDRTRSHALRIEVAGSIRRRKPQCNDIEIVALVPRQLDLLGAPVESDSQLTAAIFGDASLISRQGPRHASGVVIDPHIGAVKVDLFQTDSPADWGMLLFIRTGIADFVQRALAYWKECTRGGFCRDLRLYRDGQTIVPTPEEQAVFAALDAAARAAGQRPVPFVPPERREPRQ